jgi:hypothetical protein
VCIGSSHGYQSHHLQSNRARPAQRAPVRGKSSGYPPLRACVFWSASYSWRSSHSPPPTT